MGFKGQIVLKSFVVVSFFVIASFVSAVHAGPETQNPVPLPRPKPSVEMIKQPEPQTQPAPVSEVSGAFKTCLASLNRRGVEFVIEDPIQNDNGCEISHAVRLIAVASGDTSIALPAKPVLACSFALRLATWLADVGGPVVQSFAKSPLKSVVSGPGYVCRNRYNKKGGKISEHARGNAIDITGFKISSRRNIPVSAIPDGPSHDVRMLSALRISSCGYFTTVLGPGTNAAHKSHFHLDYGKHGRTWNYRICE